jgi:plasmid stabilization system protein ParE
MTLTIAKAAEKDLHEAFIWYVEKESRLGQRFEKSVKSAVASILDNPLQFPARYGETRVCFLNSFPYGIHYRVRQNEIIIAAIFHTSQNPARWEKR